MTPESGKRKRPEQHKTFARAVTAGKGLKEAFLEAGYSEMTARKGRAGLTQPLLDALAAEGLNYAKIASKLHPGQVEQTIEGRLYANLVSGESRGNEAAKLLGTMKKHNLFQADSTVGVILIQPSERSAKMLQELTPELPQLPDSIPPE